LDCHDKARFAKRSQRRPCVQQPKNPKRGILIDVKPRKEDESMLGWTIFLLIVSLIAGVLGFGGIAGAAVGIAKILFFIFLVLFVLSLIFGRRGLV
jgi:uncharacterized membrane protein YtjA (UPF0391 family)